MNEKLQHILNLIESGNLTIDQKEDLINAVKQVDKQLTNTEFKLERTTQVKRTTTKLLEETINELEEKRLSIEQKNRELEIETALERVRSKVMGMKNSGELNETSLVFGEQLKRLGIEWQFSYFWLVNESKNQNTFWITWPDYKTSISVYTMQEAEQSFNDCLVSWRAGVKIHDNYVPPNEVKSWLDTYQRIADDAGGEAKKIMVPQTFPNGVYYYDAMMKYGSFGICINRPATAEEKNIQSRFAIEFERAYTRFLDLKRAEEQAREARVEASLEKVRGKAMAMHKSDDLKMAVETLFGEIEKLTPGTLRSGIAILDKSKPRGDIWITVKSEKGNTIQISGDEPLDIHPMLQNAYDAWKNKQDFYYELKGKELEHYYDTIEKMNFLEPVAASFHSTEKEQCQYYYNAVFDEGSIFTWFDKKPGENIKALMRRFANVFNLTYKRFLDLQKAEAQAREAMIEAALERVRARTMGMQRSDELAETAYILLQQFKILDELPEQITIGIVNETEKVIEFWATHHGEKIDVAFGFPLNEPHVVSKLYAAWKHQKKSLVIDLTGKELAEYISFKKQITGNPGDEELREGRRVINAGIFSKGMITVSSSSPKPTQSIQLLERFAGVFDLTYTRFLDLKQAEAQARESQIELGLERVRARAMAMQNSDELKELIGTVFNELTKLDLVFTRCLIMIKSGVGNDTKWWMANSEDPENPMGFYIKHHNHPPNLAYFKAWQERKLKWTYILEGQLKKDWDDFLFTETELNLLPDFVIAGMKEPSRVYLNASFNNFGNLTLATLEPLSDEHFDILLRFAKVFDLTYTRFNDLKQAEAQTKEARIEAALERVRSKTMAMQTSAELDSVIKTVYAELKQLDVLFLRCFIMIFDEQKGATWWMGGPDDNLFNQGFYVQYHSHPPHLAYLKGWEERQPKWEYLLEGKIKKDWDEFIFSKTELSKLPPPVIQHMSSFDHAYLAASFENFGCMTTGGAERLNEESFNVLNRFAKVFDQTYTRFLDLKQAEAQVKEARIESSLERVRSKAMAMHSSQDLAETVNTFFKELKLLGIVPIRCGVGVISEKTRTSSLTATTAFKQGESYNVVAELTLAGHPVLDSIFEHWKTQQEYFPKLTGKELKLYYQAMRPYAVFPDYPEDAVQFGSYFYFNEGLVFAWTDNELTEEELNIFRRFTSVISLTYRRYKDLVQAEILAKKAEEDLVLLKEEKLRTEKALTELKATQAQLIQSEKMASLGELTAGIAHEIQNPLNFVNNFSEVNSELIEELKSELVKGDQQAAINIVNDLKENESKILHHGKRADAIVKGMLQHSRSSSGQKELTDINTLTDEYLRLAYHGLRAKDKSFNAKFETDFDSSLEKISVLPQDLGRVILNLINNAFYAVSVKASTTTEKNYTPTVLVSTKKTNGKVELKIKDNGTGIPEKAIDKIFQPFFTTKPTGQGTGLGLSLSYDIITKAHGGELKVNTKEQIGSEFIVLLPIL